MAAFPQLDQQSRQLGKSNKWFHNIDGPTAESLLLRQGMDGSFLARPSASTSGDYTLSVRRENGVTHVKIQSSGEFFDLYGGDKFATLQELVNHYMNGHGTIKETNGRVIELKHPLINDENSMPHEQRGVYTPWFHKHVTGQAAEQMLKDKGKPGSFLVRTSSNQSNALVLCVLVEQQVLHIRVYCEKDGYDVGGGQKFPTLSDLVDFYRRTPMVDKSGTVVHLKQPFNATRMTAEHIGERIKELEQGQPHTGFWEEFEELQREQEDQENNRLEGTKPENKTKNRFKNILPFDKTRVILTDADPEGRFGDYINANYIEPEPVYPGCRRFIATQGPLTNTLSDFWRMVWQENCRIIVMTTKEVERCKSKCAKYWPDNGKTEEFTAPGGAILVSHREETRFEDYCVTKLEVSRTHSKEKRTVLHYYYQGWPDHNVPQNPKSLLQLLNDVDDKAKEMQKTGEIGPVISHCSAGIGRTGSVIIIDMLLNYISTQGLNSDIDIQKLTHHVRSQRSGMVQTESQYKFVYKAVQVSVEELKQKQQQEQQQQTTAQNGHDYTNLPPVQQQQQQQQASSEAPAPPPRQKMAAGP